MKEPADILFINTVITNSQTMFQGFFSCWFLVINNCRNAVLLLPQLEHWIAVSHSENVSLLFFQQIRNMLKLMICNTVDIIDHSITDGVALCTAVML